MDDGKVTDISRQQRRQAEREDEKGPGAEPQTQKPPAFRVRTICINAPDLVQLFANLMGTKNPICGAVMRELQLTHRAAQGATIQLAGFLVNVQEPLDENSNPQPSRIIPAAGPAPRNLRTPGA